MIENKVINIGLVLYKTLTLNTRLYNYVKNNIFVIVGDNGNDFDKEVEFPYIVFKRQSSSIIRTKDGEFYGNVQIRVITLSDDYEQTIKISNVLLDALLSIENKQIGDTFIYEVNMTTCNEDYIQGAFGQELTFNITIK